MGAVDPKGNPDSEQKKFATAAAQVAGWLRLLAEPGQVVELRALEVARQYGRAQTVAGYFDDLEAMAKAALMLTRSAEGVYFTLNPLDLALKARCYNKTAVPKTGGLAADKHVLRRRWLLIDSDPIRVSGVSSDAAEKRAGEEVTLRIRQWLREERGWPGPIYADSGNSYHLLYRIDLPADDSGLVSRVLKALAARFDSDKVKVDVSVFNPARICKLYGTWAHKGENLVERPHRQSKILEVAGSPDQLDPASLLPVPRELLEQLAVEAPAERRTNTAGSAASNGNGEFQHRLKVPEWLAHYGYPFKVKEGSDGWTKHLLEHCPFNPEHTGKEVAIFQGPNGELGAKCFHNSCSGKRWQEFKAAIGKPLAEHYDPPYQRLRGAKGRRRAGNAEPTPTDHAAGEGGTDDAEEEEGLKAWEIILAYFRAYYTPTFRRGGVLYSGSLGREVKKAEACLGAPSSLIEQLKEATDAKRDHHGVDEGALPKLFWTWAPTAWQDLLHSLPEEEEAAEVSTPAREQFITELSKALKRQVNLAFGGKDGEQRREMRSLIDWCQLFAKVRAWQSIRSYSCWTRRPDGEGPWVRVALRVEVFTQMGCGGALGGITQKKFSRLCEVYDVGRSVKVAGGLTRAVELATGYVAHLLAQPTTETPEGQENGQTDEAPPHARTHEETASERPSEEQPACAATG
jgi:hypothetical protein